MADKDLVFIYSDGSAKPNPGKGGYGTVVKYANPDFSVYRVDEFAEGFKTTTNNRMELMGVITGVASLQRPSLISITTDSSYVVNAFEKRWIPYWIKNDWHTSTGSEVKNPDLWQRLIELLQPHEFKFNWIKGHNGFLDNERCDYLATTAARGATFVKDEYGFLHVSN